MGSATPRQGPAATANPRLDRLGDYVRAEYTRLVRYVSARLDRAAMQESEEIVNEVVARLFERADISAPIENLGAYVYRSLKNRLIDLLRQQDGAAVSLNDERLFPGERGLTDRQGGPHAHLENQEISTALYEAVMALPRDLRVVFLMNEVEGKTFREISQATGIPPGTLMARKARAVQLLSQRLSHLKIYMED